MNKTKSLLIAAAMAMGGALAFVGCKSSSPGSAAAKPYPLNTCIVTGEKLGDHGKPYSFVYQGQEIKMCCDGCKEDFDKDPAKYLSQLNAAK